MILLLLKKISVIDILGYNSLRFIFCLMDIIESKYEEDSDDNRQCSNDEVYITRWQNFLDLNCTAC